MVSRMINHLKSNFSKDSSKCGILVVHFGTKNKDVREKTLDSLTRSIANHFSGFSVREAYASKLIIKKIYERESMQKYTPEEALSKMISEGFSHIVVQPTFVMNGTEFKKLNNYVSRFKKRFKDIRVGTPLLYSSEDYAAVAKILKNNFEYKDRATLIVGHGTKNGSNSEYEILQNTLHNGGRNNLYLTTIIGPHNLDRIIQSLKNNNISDVILVPFMIVAGTHGEKDIKGVLKPILENNGFKVEIVMKSLGEIPDIHQIFIRHIGDSLNNKKDIS